MAAAPVLLIGSVPLESSSEVFAFLGSHLGGLASQYPDGETGERINWVRWQRDVFDDNPDLRLVETRHVAGFKDTLTRPFYAIKPGSNPKAIRFKRLGYARKAIESHGEFRRLRDAGAIPSAVRFQVCLPSAVSLLTAFVELGDRAALEAPLEAALQAEVDEMAAGIPHTDLLVQWDVCHEMVGQADGIPLYYDDKRQGSVARTIRLVEMVPADIGVGIHLCYGDPGHKHIVDPPDSRDSVEMANRVTAGARRRIDYVHIPILRDWSSDDVYKPLADLKVPAGTQIYLGLVHLTDGIDGARRRIAVAKKMTKGFGVATECGFGRRNPETLKDLVALHREAAEAAG